MTVDEELELYTSDLFLRAIEARKPLVDAAPMTRIYDGLYPSLLYFIACRDRLKIGHSVSPHARASDLTGACPYQITIMGVLPGGRTEEQKIHWAMRRRHCHCEWFHMDDLVEEIVCKHSFVYRDGFASLGMRKPMHPDTSKRTSPLQFTARKRRSIIRLKNWA